MNTDFISTIAKITATLVGLYPFHSFPLSPVLVPGPVRATAIKIQ